MHGCMDGWVGGYRWMNEKNAWLNEWMNEWMDGCLIYVRMHGWMNG